jgi:hypothetical protein
VTNEATGTDDAAQPAKRGKKTWSDLSPAARAAIIIGGVGEVIVTTLALRDLMRRPRRRVRGPKLLWAASFVVQPFGPLLYFAVGRRPKPKYSALPGARHALDAVNEARLQARRLARNLEVR